MPAMNGAVDAWVQQALAHHQAGELAQAGAVYQRVLALQPQLAMAHNNLGLACVALGQPIQAVRHFQQAPACQPDDADAHNTLGSALAAVGRPDAAAPS